MIYHFVAEQTDAGLDFDITLDKNKKVYCFIGDNAVGKTNLLENIARTLVYCHSMFKNGNGKYSGIYVQKPIHDEIKIFSLRLALNIILNEKNVKNKENDKWMFAAFEAMQTNRSAINLPFTIDKPIVFIGAKNRGYTKNIDRNHIKILGNQYDRFLEAFIRSFNYMNGKAIEETEVADWFNSRLIINPSYIPQAQNREAEVITVFELVQKLEPSLNLIPLPDKIKNEARLDIIFSEGELYINSIPINKLSTGFVSIIKIFQEIIVGYGGWTGLYGDKTDLRHVEGIVFIDEIESHLHPKWQYRIISLLKEFFPKTTFYIATHSPLIISTTDEGEAYELSKKGNKVTAHQLGNPQEWYLTDVFAQAFHIDFINSTSTFSEKEGSSLLSMLKDFSNKVKDYVNNKDDSLKKEAEDLYQKILPSLAKDDPRRRSLDSLRSLLG
jgi:predicted ATP-dependent endonuclease of OLD family